MKRKLKCMVQEEIVRRENERRNQSDLTSPPVSDTYAGTPVPMFITLAPVIASRCTTLIFGRMFQEVGHVGRRRKTGQ